jgi:hypothetical protein
MMLPYLDKATVMSKFVLSFSTDLSSHVLLGYRFLDLLRKGVYSERFFKKNGSDYMRKDRLF